MTAFWREMARRVLSRLVMTPNEYELTSRVIVIVDAVIGRLIVYGYVALLAYVVATLFKVLVLRSPP